MLIKATKFWEGELNKCLAKMSFKKAWHAAEFAGTRKSINHLRPYRCYFCGLWHLTSGEDANGKPRGTFLDSRRNNDGGNA